MSSAWWRRNRAWLIALPFLLALALLASSQRLINSYLPWEPYIAVTVRDGEIDFRQRQRLSDGQEFERRVHVRLLGVTQTEEFDGIIASDGATLWRVDLEFEAAPDQLLDPCTIELVANNVRYSAKAGKELATSSNWRASLTTIRCVPQDTPGPKIEAFTTNVKENTPPRPTQWSNSAALALPTGVTPESLMLWWSTPEYLLFPLDL